MTVTLLHGDCLEHMAAMATASIDSIVTDPPAGISFMNRHWDGDKGGRDLWIAWMQQVAAEALRVAKPGAHALVWALPRTSHWTATAWENAGWEVRDRVSHLFGTGFPKSLDISKAIDKAAGAGRDVIGTRSGGMSVKAGGVHNFNGRDVDNGVAMGSVVTITAPATPEAQQWAGWGTALKPACEDWWLLRKPLSEKTIAANVLRWGTGALAIDACRVGTSKDVPASASDKWNQQGWGYSGNTMDSPGKNPNIGRFPANILHDGSDEVLAAFAAFGTKTSGTAARFFYSAKASRAERQGSKHPCVKPLALMRWLVRLICPPGGTVLDMFAGSGTTLQAAQMEGFDAVGIEREADYVQDARRRLGMTFNLEAAD